MSNITQEDINKQISKLQICMLTTVDSTGVPDTRPMSNRQNTNYEGTSYFFTTENTLMVEHIRENSSVSLSYTENSLFTKLYICLNGEASIINQKDELRLHWNSELDKWFEDGIDTEGLVMISIRTDHVKVWRDEEFFEYGTYSMGHRQGAESFDRLSL